MRRSGTHSTEEVGDCIGRYKLLEKIGEGGMGIVYMAEQRRPVFRRVALKIIKAGMDTRQVVARFEAERQALALMDHPNIAKVLDAGTTESGRPYFVMDLVKGMSIIQFCDAAKLSTRHRLDLFLDVCSAIQHAHQKGIIHRDIKPTNILVTLHGDKPVPRVIDFGIAKATQQPLTEKTVFTQFQHFIGTPAYMSPEQASLSGLDIDTRSDIYGLGVLLYELLTGKTPFGGAALLKAGLDGMRRAIREESPLPPSTRLKTLQGQELTTTAQQRSVQALRLVELVRGDLDWIVMKCLEKDRNRRYATANGLASDIKRHLTHEPILARPPSRLYEFQRTVRRHQFGFAATAAVLLVLTGGVVISTSQAVRAKRAEREQIRLREQAQRAESQRADELAKYLLAFARASRQSGEPGRRSASLDAISRAAAIRPSAELRNEAIAALALTDLGKAQVWRAAIFTNNWNWDRNYDFDPDLERYAVGRSDKAISICRVADQQELFRIPPANAEGRCVKFSPDGKWLAVRHDDDWLRVWDLDRQVKTVEVQLGGKLSWSLDFSPDNRRVVAGSTDNSVRSFDVATGVETNLLRGSLSPAHLSFDPAGKVLAIHDGTRCELWDWQQFKLLRAFSPAASPSVSGARNPQLTAWAWHPDRMRAAGGSNGGEIFVWDTQIGNSQVVSQPYSYVARLSFNPRGDLLVSHGWDSTTRVWDAQTGHPILRTEGGYALRFSRDGERLAFFRDHGEFGVWPVVSSGVFRSLNTRVQQRAADGGCTFSPDGRFLFWGQVDGIRWVNLLSGEVEFQELANPGIVGFSADGNSFFTANQNGVLSWPVSYETNTMSVRLRLGPATQMRMGSGKTLKIVTSSKDGQMMVGGSADEWFIADRGKAERIVKYPTRFNSGNCFLISTDKRWVALGFWMASAFVCDARNGEPVKEFPEVRAGILAFTPDGRWLVTCSQDEYRFWQTGTWQPGPVLKRDLASAASGAIAFEPEGRLMAIARTAYSVQLVNANNGEVLAELTSPNPHEVRRLCFSPDGGLLAVTGMEGIHLWDLRQLRRELTTLGLDWSFPPYPPSALSPATVTFRAGQGLSDPSRQVQSSDVSPL
jgi:eukaryotic-like serine/threonine-protein kinase